MTSWRSSCSLIFFYRTCIYDSLDFVWQWKQDRTMDSSKEMIYCNQTSTDSTRYDFITVYREISTWAPEDKVKALKLRETVWTEVDFPSISIPQWEPGWPAELWSQIDLIRTSSKSNKWIHKNQSRRGSDPSARPRTDQQKYCSVGSRDSKSEISRMVMTASRLPERTFSTSGLYNNIIIVIIIITD